MQVETKKIGYIPTIVTFDTEQEYLVFKTMLRMPLKRLVVTALQEEHSNLFPCDATCHNVQERMWSELS